MTNWLTDKAASALLYIAMPFVLLGLGGFWLYEKYILKKAHP